MEQDRHIEEALKPLNNAEMSTKLKKFLYFTKDIDQMGHIITKLHVATWITEAIKVVEYPPTVSELQSFLR